jgi:RND family efflux transporter MFP subunit
MRRLALYLGPLLILACVGASAEVTVTARPLEKLLSRPVRSAPARVESLNHSLLSAEITGRVLEIRVRVGDPVAEGDPLVRLDCRDHRSRLAAQQAVLRQVEIRRRLAVSQLRRARNLETERNISEEQLEQRETEVETLSAELAAQGEAVAQARLQVERCEVRSPFDAVVDQRIAQVGALATPGSPLVRVVEQSTREVAAQLTRAEVLEVQQAGRLELLLDGQRFPLRLRRLVPVVDARAQTQEARLTPESADLPPGAAGRLQWEARRAELRADLVVRRDGRLGVFTIERDHARFHPLPHALEGQPVAVELAPETLVAVEGRQRLTDGEPVQVSPADGP